MMPAAMRPFSGSLVIVRQPHLMRRAMWRDPLALVLAPHDRLVGRGGLISQDRLWRGHVLLIAALFGRPGVAISVFELAEMVWSGADGGPDSWRECIEALVTQTRGRLAPLGLTIGRPITHHKCSAEWAAPAMARAA